MNRQPYNLTLLINNFAHGGSERQFIELVTRLDPRRFRVTIGCLAQEGPFLARLRAHDFDIHALRERGGPVSVRMAAKSLHLARWFRKQRTHLVHAFDFYTNIVSLPAAWLARVPVVLGSRRDTGQVWRPSRRFVLRQSFRFADMVVANSEAARIGLIAEGIEKGRTCVIHNGVDLELFSPTGNRADIRRQLGWEEDSLLVATVSNLRPEKNHQDFIAAVPAVVRRVPNARFVIVGAGSTGPRLRALVEDRGLSDQVKFLGDRTDVPELLRAIDVLVLPSLTESFPNAVLEAMAAGRPVVATAVGGVRELVDAGRTGFLVPPGQRETLADRISVLLEQPNIRAEMGRAARARVEAEFDIRKSAVNFENLYEEMLERKIEK